MEGNNNAESVEVDPIVKLIRRDIFIARIRELVLHDEQHNPAVRECTSWDRIYRYVGHAHMCAKLQKELVAYRCHYPNAKCNQIMQNFLHARDCKLPRRENGQCPANIFCTVIRHAIRHMQVCGHGNACQFCFIKNGVAWQIRRSVTKAQVPVPGEYASFTEEGRPPLPPFIQERAFRARNWQAHGRYPNTNQPQSGGSSSNTPSRARLSGTGLSSNDRQLVLASNHLPSYATKSNGSVNPLNPHAWYYQNGVVKRFVDITEVEGYNKRKALTTGNLEESNHQQQPKRLCVAGPIPLPVSIQDIKKEKDPENLQLVPLVARRQPTPPPSISDEITFGVVKQECGMLRLNGKKEGPYTPQELKITLLPLYEKILGLKDAMMFAESGVIDDLHAELMKPTSLSTIRRKLDHYTDPWEFVCDITGLFEKGVREEKKSTKKYKSSKRLLDQTGSLMNEVMRQLGYCCGQKFSFLPFPIICANRQDCRIREGDAYYNYIYADLEGDYSFCASCFMSYKGDTIDLNHPFSCDDPLPELAAIPKSAFKLCINNKIFPEPMVKCITCSKKFHKICVSYLEAYGPEDGFICPGCCTPAINDVGCSYNISDRFPKSQLSEHIERRLNVMLERERSSAVGRVHVRVLSNCIRETKIKPKMRRFLASNRGQEEDDSNSATPAENMTLPYRAKGIYVFETMDDGKEVCFFGMYAQEYGGDVAMPNQRRVYVSYIDSVQYFDPRHLRTQLYFEVILAYFDWLRNLGYMSVHVWASPPTCDGDDYIFFRHPPGQKIPKKKRLLDWYKRLFELGVRRKIIVTYSDIYRQIFDYDKLRSVAEVPYFDGDVWPDKIEELLGKLMPKEDARKRGLGRRGNPTEAKLMGQLKKEIFKLKDVHFVVTLNFPRNFMSSPPGPDSDPLVEQEMFHCRDEFLRFARERRLEFSSIRRAKYSTLVLMHELCKTEADAEEEGRRFPFNCDLCHLKLRKSFRCTECEDFDMCDICFEEVGHSHLMQIVDEKIPKALPPPPSQGTSVALVPYKPPF